MRIMWLVDVYDMTHVGSDGAWTCFTHARYVSFICQTWLGASCDQACWASRLACCVLLFAALCCSVLQPSLSAPPQPPKRLSKYTETREPMHVFLWVSVSYPCVSQALGKAAGCICCRHWKEHDSERAARCVIYIFTYVSIHVGKREREKDRQRYRGQEREREREREKKRERERKRTWIDRCKRVSGTEWLR